jgi:mono/diheme cytochrome c family protein
MKGWLFLLVFPALSLAADDAIAQGAAIFRANCSVAYCHGPEGKPGRAPGFVGRRIPAGAIAQIVSSGIRNTAMPPFEKALKEDEIRAVAAYLVSLGGTATPATAAAPVKLPPEIERGRVLFFDPGRTGSCGNCHEAGGRGAPVSLALQDLHSARLDLKSIQSPEVVTVRPEGEQPFPAVVIEKSAVRVRVYDLSGKLPVLRSFVPAEVTLATAAAWRHDSANSLYSAAELGAIEGYLKWMAAQ